VGNQHHLQDGIVENAVMTGVIHIAVTAGHAVGHFIVYGVAGLFDGEQFIVTRLESFFVHLVEITGDHQFAIVSGGINRDDVFAVVNLIDTFFKCGHPGVEVFAFGIPECLLHLFQINLAGRALDFGGYVVLLHSG